VSDAAVRASGESIDPEPGNVVLRAARCHEVGDDLADDAAELEAVPGARRDNECLGTVGQPVDNEVLVRRVREEARAVLPSI
jgi:hypothetical protein